jgi:predicted nucleotidyltransferase
MFTVEERQRVRGRLLDLAAADSAVTGAAVTGSHAAGNSDQWSDIDLALAIPGSLAASLEQWTDVLYRDFAAVHHWDLRSGSAVYRVFLLPGWLEVDIAFIPAAEFGPLGPNWRTVFGATVPLEPSGPPEFGQLAGLAWHHALHARVSIERQRYLQAEYWIGAMRSQVTALACLRLGYPDAYAKTAHRLPADVTARLAETLVRSLDPAELHRALAAATTTLSAELESPGNSQAGRLGSMLTELTR